MNKFGIYRDDDLAIVETKSGPIIERLSKRLRKVLNRLGLEITIESNLVKTDFLDVELDLRNDTFAPFRKPNFQATYVNVKSNHPRYVVNQVPKSINKRLTILSKEKSYFNRAKGQNQEVLVKGGHKHELKYKVGYGEKTKRKR